MPAWQAAVVCAAAVSESTELAVMQTAAVHDARCNDPHASNERSMSLLLTYIRGSSAAEGNAPAVIAI
jgi:hypothetical protein